MKHLMSGNEATARGVYEAGIKICSAYPGTPSTEILENLPQYKDDVYCEWAPNEKVATEVAYGASIAGSRSFCTMKMVGLNVAADPLFTAGYMGVGGAFIVVTADDPSCHSSQNEQDNRHYARAAKIAMVEPSDAQECKDFVALACEVSELFDTPVLYRTTTRVCHSKGLVQWGERREHTAPPYRRNVRKFVCTPAHAYANHPLVEERLRRVEYLAEDSVQTGAEIRFEAYSAILVDEAHLLSPNTLEILLEIGKTRPVIFSSNCEDMISPEELDLGAIKLLGEQPGIQTFHLTNRIRANEELSYFIQNMMHLPHGRGMRHYPHVAVVYANDESEAANLLNDYIRQGYECQESDWQEKLEKQSDSAVEIQSRHTREVDRMVHRLDGRYYYDEMGYLRSTERDVRHLFYQLSEAKEELALVVMGNEKLYGTLLNLF